MTLVSLLFPFLVDGPKSRRSLLGGLKLESAFPLVDPGLELPLAVVLTLTLHCVSELSGMVLALWFSL